MSFTKISPTRLIRHDSAYYPCRRECVQILLGLLWRAEDGRKKKLGRCPEEQRPNPDSRRVTEATQGERQPSHVHVTVAYLYSEAWLAVAHTRSARANFRQPLASEDAVPIGFCSGGFTSTSSLR